MTREVLGWVLLGGALLVVLGLLLGWAWTRQALEPKLRKQAEERRKLNAEWTAVRTARRQQGECSRCASPLADRDWFYAPILVEDSDEPVATDSIGVSRSATRIISTSPTIQESQQRGRSSSELVQPSIPPEQGQNHNGSEQTMYPVTIYLSDESVHEQVEAAVEDLLAATGVQVEHRDDPVFGSWFRRMRARAGQAVHSPLAREAAAVAAHAAELGIVHARDATITSTMLENLGPVLTALHPTKDAVIRAGALLIVKVDWIVVIHQLTPAQQLQLNHQPQLAQSPHSILSALHVGGYSMPAVEALDGVCGSTTVPPSLNGNPAPHRIVSNNAEDSTPRNVADPQTFPEASPGSLD